jgi:uncharacterized protein (DUF2141 family)
MKQTFWILFLLLALSLVPAGAELYPTLGTITVKIEGIETSEGFIRATLFDKKERWMNEERAAVTKVVKAQAGEMVIEMEAPLGKRYALAVHHDQNGNGKMDTGFPIPKPTEPVGASYFTGNAIPRFYECSFRFSKEPMELLVKLRKP